MGFKDRKRDDHGHVIGNDETDGQKCQHGAGGGSDNNRQDVQNRLDAARNNLRKINDVENIAKYNREIDGLEKQLSTMPDDSFDDDYEEEFKEPSPEDEKQYVDKVMADIANASDKKAFEYVSDNIDELTEAGLITDETSDKLYAKLDEKIDEVNGDIDNDLIKAINAADDDVLDDQFGKDTPERKLAGVMKGQPAGEATTKDEWTKRHNDFLERGKSTWNQKLQKGDKVTFEGKDGKDIEGYIGGFWNGGKLTDEDAYEEGKDNNWHDFRGVGIVDKDGKELGNINAYQIKNHNREQLGTPEDFAKKTAKMPNGKEMSLFDFAHNIVNYLDNDTAAYIIASKYGVSENDAKAYLESPYNREGSKEDYNRKLVISNNTKVKKKKDGTYEINGQTFPDEKSLIEVYGEEIKKHIVPED